MANLIQIKRSDLTTDPANTDIVDGELAYSYVSSSNSLFIGNGDGTVGGSATPIRIGGGKYLWLHQSNTSSPGAATANAVVITNGNGFVTALKSNELRVGVDGTSVAIANISTFANTTQLGTSASGANTELVTSYAVKTYVDNQSARQTNTYVSFGANNLANGGSSSFTFNSGTSTLTVTNISSSGTHDSGNTTVTGFLTVSGTANVGALNASGAVAAGNTTVTGFVNVSSYGTFGGTVNATALNISGVTASGNTTVTGFVNVSSYGTFGGTVNAAAGNITNNLGVGGNLTVTGTKASGNSTITGFANVTTTLQVGGQSTLGGNVVVTGTANVSSDLNVGGNMAVTGNLTVSGTLTTISTNNLVIEDSMISLANENTGDLLDTGFYATYNDGAAKYTGLFRDQTDTTYKLFTGLTVQPTLTVDTSNASFTYATLQSHLKAGGTGATGLVANATNIAITANSTLAVAITANTLSLTTALPGSSGGTGLSSYTAEDLLVANSSNGFRKLSKGSEGTVLQISGGVVAYGALDGGTF
ncbi:hypothetical protein EBT25_07270 [bacterium]|jgi:hypothetical protein|nr:hypothetical protein [bacterium]